MILTNQEFSYLQQYLQEMYESAALREGPSGDLIINLRDKFIVSGLSAISDKERRFLLFALQDTYQSSHTPIVGSQLGTTMKLLINPSSNTLNQWDVIISIMTKLGLEAPQPYTPIKVGPDGDLDGISTPMHHDINDGTGYNHR